MAAASYIKDNWHSLFEFFTVVLVGYQLNAYHSISCRPAGGMGAQIHLDRHGCSHIRLTSS